MGYENMFYGWSFSTANGKVVDLRPSIEDLVGVSEEELSKTLDNININGEGLSYTLSVDGREAGTIDIPKDTFLKAVEYKDGYIIFTIGTSDDDVTTVSIPASEIISEDAIADTVNTAIAEAVKDYYTKSDVDDKIAESVDALVGGAPEAMDTLAEIATVVGEVRDTMSEIVDELDNKANASNVYTKDEADAKFLTEHQSLAEYATLEDVEDNYQPKGDYALKDELPEVPTNVSAFANDADYATKDEVDDRIKGVVGAAPEALDTLGEIAKKLADDDDAVAAIVASVSDETAARQEADAEIYKDILKRIWSTTDKDANGYFKTKYDHADGSYAQMWNESDGGGSQYYNKADDVISYVGVNDGGKDEICAQIYSKNKTTNVGSRLNINPNGMFYKVSENAQFTENDELAVKGDVANSKEELETIIVEKDATIAKLNSELYSLKQVVASIGGAVTYEYPGIDGKPFGTLIGNNGTVKLAEDVSVSRVVAGVIASNKATLNLNGKKCSVSGVSPYGAFLLRGTQELTIKGNGTLENTAKDATLIWTSAEGVVVNLGGTKNTLYQADNSAGEVIYCEKGIINITGGVYRNLNENKNFLLNCKDANYKAGTANIIVSSTSKTSGPMFYDFNPADNASEGAGTSFVAEGCTVNSSVVTEEDGEHTIYTVVKES